MSMTLKGSTPVFKSTAAILAHYVPDTVLYKYAQEVDDLGELWEVLNSEFKLGEIGKTFIIKTEDEILSSFETNLRNRYTSLYKHIDGMNANIPDESKRFPNKQLVNGGSKYSPKKDRELLTMMLRMQIEKAQSVNTLTETA